MATHPCPGGCGRQLLLPGQPCNDCRLRLPGPIRARLHVTTVRRHTAPAQYQDALISALAWYRDNPRKRGGRGE